MPDRHAPLRLRRMIVVLVVSTLLASLPALADQPKSEVAADQAATENWRLEKETLDFEVGAEERLRLVNHHGEIHVRGAGDGKVEVYATAQRHADDPRLPKIETNRGEGEWSLEVSYPGDAEVPSPPDAWRKRRIDLVVFVPRGASLELESRHGKLRAKGLVGPVEARSESGAIGLVTAGSVDARSLYGAVTVKLEGISWETPPRLSTLTGAIRLDLPWRAEPRALLETRGNLTSDYSIEIEWLPETFRKRGLVGAGEPTSGRIELTSDRGDLQLLRRPPPPGT